MTILDSIYTAQIHREVYIALLNSALQKPGSKRSLATQIGVTPQYLSYLLNPENNDPYSSRIPSDKVTEKIARALPLEYEQREELLQHMHLARDSTSHLLRTLSSELLTHPVEYFLKELRTADQEANAATDPHVFRVKYLVIRDTCKMLLNHSLLYTFPLNTVEACMFLHEVQCILNQTGDALYHAKLAHTIMDSLSRNDYPDKERFDSYQIQVICAEARAYSDLQLYQEAYEKCLQAETSDAARYQSAAWISQLYRDKLQALCRKPRFALNEAEGLVAKVRAICDSTDNDSAPLWLFTTNQYMARAYLHHHNLKKAEKLLTAGFEQINHIPHLSPLHQTIFLKTYARLYWEEGDYTDWEYFLKRALAYAVDAGLAHQISDIKRTYGQSIIPLLADLESR